LSPVGRAFAAMGSGVALAVLLSIVLGRPGPAVTIRGQARGLPPGVPARAVATRGDCLDPQRPARPLAEAALTPSGAFRLDVVRAPAGIGAVCVFAGSRAGVSRLPPGPLVGSVTVTLGPAAPPAQAPPLGPHASPRRVPPRSPR
jgi:hypothetical protein